MKKHHIVFLIKLSTVLGGINFVLLFVYPIIYSICCGNNANYNVMMNGYKINLGLMIIFGLTCGILTFASPKLLTKTKLCKHSIAYDSKNLLLQNLNNSLTSKGYKFVADNNVMEKTSSLYKKQRVDSNDYFLIVDECMLNEYKNPTRYEEILYNNANIKINSQDNVIIIFCFEQTDSIDIEPLKRLSVERLFGGCLVGILDFKQQMLSYDKLVDGFAPGRQQQKIKLLKSVLNIGSH